MIPTRRQILMLALIGRLAEAADPWKDKKSADWSEKDIEKLLNRSPWAREATVSFSPPEAGEGLGERVAESDQVFPWVALQPAAWAALRVAEWVVLPVEEEWAFQGRAACLLSTLSCDGKARLRFAQCTKPTRCRPINT